MSRIGKKTVPIPKGVTVSAADGTLTVKGPKGELQLQLRSEVAVAVGPSEVRITSIDQERSSRALQGTTRALLANMVVGVTTGYQKKLEVSGVGYQAVLQGNKLELSLGFSKPVRFEIPATVTVEVPTPTTILIKGKDKQQVGAVAAAIRKLRKPEPYKGKGIKYRDEVVRRKAGKAFASGGTT
jgi:large subunit ribosomal protein L6